MKPDMTPLLIAAEQRGHAIHFGIHMLNSQLDLMMQFLGLDRRSPSLKLRLAFFLECLDAFQPTPRPTCR